MAFYNELGLIINKSVELLLEDQNLCKLLYYYPSNVDMRYDPISQPYIDNPNELLLTHIYPMPKIPDAETAQTCFIDVTVYGGEEIKDNPRFRKIVICFDVICHLDCWMVKGGYRPIKIISEIDSIFNYKIFDVGAVNKLYALPLIPKDYSNKFYGYQVCYELQVNSNIEC